MNQLAIHKNLSEQFNLTKLNLGFILLVFIFCQKINAPNLNILNHRYFSFVVKLSLFTNFGVFQILAMYGEKKQQQCLMQMVSMEKTQKHVIWFPLTSGLMTNNHFGTDDNVKWNSPHHDSCFTDIIPRINIL